MGVGSVGGVELGEAGTVWLEQRTHQRTHPLPMA